MQTLLVIGSVLMLSAPTLLAEEIPPELELPVECLPYSKTTADIESSASWNQVLSFAACVQDTSIEHIDQPDQLPAFISRLELALVPTMAFYAAALQHGPGPIQLRAAFQIGMMHVALITRARASLVAPHDRKTNPASAAHYRELQQRLEPLLHPPAKLAWTMFAVIDRVAADDPSLVADDVVRNMVRAAHELEPSLRWSLAEPSPESSSPALVAW